MLTLTIKPERDLLALGLNAAAGLDLVGLVAAGVAQGRHDDDLFEERNVRHLNEDKFYTQTSDSCVSNQQSYLLICESGLKFYILKRI